ncbi:MAG: DUF3127 domain-containing protein [Prevotella sp.]|nr:DUF3127 domain-containing protein [Prevotella sp.]
MELQGKVIVALPERSGVSARGEWKSQSFVIETHEAYSRKMMFDVFGADRLARYNIQVGQEVLVSFDIDAHEYNGRWFNSIRAFDVRLVDPAQYGAQGAQGIPASNGFGGSQPQNVAAAPASQAPFPPQQSAAETESADDLPF